MSARGGNTFDPKVVFGLLVFGALAFFLTLYFIGTGQTGQSENDGAPHAGGKGLVGYAAIARLLEEEGHEVELLRSQGNLDDEGLLVLTPPKYADPEEVAEAIDRRRYIGPTLLILPKWNAMEASMMSEDAKDGWVTLFGTSEPQWAEELDQDFNSSFIETQRRIDVELDIKPRKGGFAGLDRRGALPDESQVQAMESGNVRPMVLSPDGAILVGYLQDWGEYPVLEDALGDAPPPATVPDDDPPSVTMSISPADEDYSDEGLWAVVVVAEPDLINNYGMADRTRAELAHYIVDLAMEGEDLPVMFDLTFNGIGQTQNLLTLAFTPPFLAATLCLIIAMIVVAWRALRRFGPAVAEGRDIAYGKARLVRNSASFIQRTRRHHLLSQPYADLMRERLARALAVRRSDDEALDRALAGRLTDEEPPSRRLSALENARAPQDILRAADALKDLERKLAR